MAKIMTQRGKGARQRAREAMRAQVATIAVDLFVEHGFDATTVDDICQEAEISRSSFFRYFATKEDVLFDELADTGDELLDALTARPDDEAPWTALRRALTPLIEHYNAEPDRAQRIARLVITTPTLAARHHEKNARWHELLRPEVARRLGASPNATDPLPTAMIGAALACVDATIDAWVAANQDEPLEQILDRAMGAITLRPHRGPARSGRR